VKTVKKKAENKPATNVAEKNAEQPAPITPRFQWTNNGNRVLVVKCVGTDGSAYGGFKHPTKVGDHVTAPDWDPKPECGNGIHGWAWGFELGEGMEPEYRDALWLVYAVDPALIIDISGKCKFQTGELVYSGNWVGAIVMTLDGRRAWSEHAARGSAAATGWRGSAAATGWRGSAAATGERFGTSSTARESSSNPPIRPISSTDSAQADGTQAMPLFENL
jgi:hypothetical protein